MSLDVGHKRDDEEDDDAETMLTFLSSGAWTLDILSGPVLVLDERREAERRVESSRVVRTESSFHLDLSLSTRSSQADQLYRALFQVKRNACKSSDGRRTQSNIVTAASSLLPIRVPAILATERS